jgi:hypothetical protein
LTVKFRILTDRYKEFIPIFVSAHNCAVIVVLFIRPPTCIYARESRSPEPFAFEILHRQRANKVFGKRPHATARDRVIEPCCFDVIDPTASTSSTLLLTVIVIYQYV